MWLLHSFLAQEYPAGGDVVVIPSDFKDYEPSVWHKMLLFSKQPMYARHPHMKRLVALCAVADSSLQGEKSAASAFLKLALNTLRTVSSEKAKTVTYYRGGEMLTANRKTFTISAVAPSGTIMTMGDLPSVPVELISVEDELEVESGDEMTNFENGGSGLVAEVEEGSKRAGKRRRS